MAILHGDRLWRVVGGTSTGGIIVREGKETSSEQCKFRLEAGTLIKELELDGERLKYFRLANGSGPNTGWVSIKLKDKDLVRREDVPPAPEAETVLPIEFQSIGGRKMRILALPGAGSNSNILKFMLAPLMKSLGSKVEWLWLEPSQPWQPTPGGESAHSRERSDLEVKLSKGLPFTQWYEQSEDGSAKQLWKLDESFQYIEDFITKEMPIDAVLAFSGGAVITSLYIDHLRLRSKPVPWRLSIFFSGGILNDERYLFRERSLHPVIMISGIGDGPHRALKLKGTDMYSKFTFLEHEEGHAIPRKPPHAEKIYAVLQEELCKSCGIT